MFCKIKSSKLVNKINKLLVGSLHPRYGKPGTMAGKTVLPITIGGITYRSKNAACRALNINYYQLGKLT